MLSLEKWYRFYLQNGNRDTNIENKHTATKGEKRRNGMNWEGGIDMYIMLCMEYITTESLFLLGTVLDALW